MKTTSAAKKVPVNVYVDKRDQVCADIPSTCVSAWCAKKKITVQFLNCGHKPSGILLAAAQLLASGDIDHSAIIAKAAIAHWNASLRRNPDWFKDFKPMKTARDLIGRLKIGTIYIHAVERVGGGIRHGFAGSWEIDDEHGLGVLIHNGAVKEVGHEEITFTEEDAPVIGKESATRSEIKSLRESIERRRETLKLNGGSPVGVLGMMAEAMPDFRKEMLAQIAQVKKRIAELEAHLPSKK